MLPSVSLIAANHNAGWESGNLVKDDSALSEHFAFGKRVNRTQSVIA